MKKITYYLTTSQRQMYSHGDNEINCPRKFPHLGHYYEYLIHQENIVDQ